MQGRVRHHDGFDLGYQGAYRDRDDLLGHAVLVLLLALLRDPFVLILIRNESVH